MVAGDGTSYLLGDQPPLPSIEVMVKLSTWSGLGQILDGGIRHRVVQVSWPPVPVHWVSLSLTR